MMKIRRMSRKDWTIIKKKRQWTESYEFDGRKGKISILMMDEVEKAFVIHGERKEHTICAKGYAWVQFGFEESYFWGTAMFDEYGRFCEIYFDLTNGDHMDEDDPWFEDMYLDYVLLPDEIVELDRDELDAAFQKQEFSEEMYHRTIEEGQKLKEYLKNNKEKIIREAEIQYKILLTKIG